MPGCQCSSCTEDARIDVIIKSGNPDELITVINDLRTKLICAESDNDYYEAILDGSWPNSIWILKRALKKARTLRVKALTLNWVKEK